MSQVILQGLDDCQTLVQGVKCQVYIQSISSDKSPSNGTDFVDIKFSIKPILDNGSAREFNAQYKSKKSGNKFIFDISGNPISLNEKEELTAEFDNTFQSSVSQDIVVEIDYTVKELNY